jgi:NAD(P)-dependent dehydrogenase (short-subunit alcohol dehydrogenase family)
MADERIAIVTGASRGIGRGIAQGLARAGYAVVVNYASNADAAREVQEQIQSAGGRAETVRADVSVAADREELVAATLRTFGRIDLLVNNAGIAPSVRADLLDASEESFDRLINVNLKGPYFLTQRVAREMIRQVSDEATKARSDEGNGSREPSPSVAPSLRRSVALPKIVSVTSISAYTASVNRGDYCVAKAGLAMMTQLFAARLAEHGINVYEIRPGVIETDMTGPVKAKYDDLIFNKDLTPIRRWGQPADVARAVVAIATDLLPFSTGEVINVDGGFHLRRL